MEQMGGSPGTRSPDAALQPMARDVAAAAGGAASGMAVVAGASRRPRDCRFTRPWPPCACPLQPATSSRDHARLGALVHCQHGTAGRSSQRRQGLRTTWPGARHPSRKTAGPQHNETRQHSFFVGGSLAEVECFHCRHGRGRSLPGCQIIRPELQPTEGPYSQCRQLRRIRATSSRARAVLCDARQKARCKAALYLLPCFQAKKQPQ